MTLNESSLLDDRDFEALVVRARLSKLDRARLIAKRREPYERLYTVSRQGGDRRSAAARARLPASRPQSFVAATAAVTSFAPRTIQRLLRIGENILPELQEALAPTPLANRQDDLYRIADMTPDAQQELLKRLQDAEHPPPSLVALMNDRNAPTPPRKSVLDRLEALWAKTPSEDRQRFLRDVWSEASEAEREALRAWLTNEEDNS